MTDTVSNVEKATEIYVGIPIIIIISLPKVNFAKPRKLLNPELSKNAI